MFDDSMIILHMICQIPMNCPKITFSFCDGSRNIRKLFSVSCEVLILHGKDCIHRVARSCTKTAYR